MLSRGFCIFCCRDLRSVSSFCLLASPQLPPAPEPAPPPAPATDPPADCLSDAAEDADSIAALTIAAVLNVLLNQGEGWITHPVEDVVKKARIRLWRVLGS